MRGVDRNKDQSYVLFGTNKETLAHTLLPVGGFTKPRIREMAEELDLPVFDKPDSQEICFVPDQDYAGLVSRKNGGLRGGEIVDTAGRKLGEHGGFQKFTVGQRRGLGVAAKVPLYVVAVEPAAGRVVVGDKADLMAGGLVADQINLIADRAVSAFADLRCSAKIRYNAKPVRRNAPPPRRRPHPRDLRQPAVGRHPRPGRLPLRRRRRPRRRLDRPGRGGRFRVNCCEMTTLTLDVPADLAEALSDAAGTGRRSAEAVAVESLAAEAKRRRAAAERIERLDRLHARIKLPPIDAATIRQAIQEGRPRSPSTRTLSRR